MTRKYQLDGNAVKRLIPRLNVPSLYEYIPSKCLFVGADDESEDRPCRHPIVFENYLATEKHVYYKHRLTAEEKMLWLWMYEGHILNELGGGL